ncbi:DUF1566 domain-containing protein [Ectothiorhodospiraceae bacterium BW-2]|nr:DUF1566 domain-containing protein [Ectothiorhodospiraceae bacterium BW-2]
MKTLLTLLCLLLTTLSLSAQTENRTALVLGNSAYQSSPLKNPVNDARAIKKALQQSGFKVIYQENGSRTEMFNKIRDFGNELRQRKGVGVVFYAGHGMQVNGENYLIPVNANINAEDEIEIQALPLQSVLNKLNSAGNKLNMVYLDACRDNPFARSFRSSSRGLARVSAPTGTKIYYATKPGEVAHDGKGANGIFTSHLMKALTTPGLNQNEVFQQTAAAVMAETKEQQVPWEEGLITGTFYFIDAPIQVAGGTSQIIPPPQPAALTGTLAVTSSPNGGATIRLDGASVGATPVTLPNLPANKGESGKDYQRPTIHPQAFPDTPDDWFWSSSPNAYYSDFSWVVGFDDGGANVYYRDHAGSVRLVRAGQ